MYHIALCDDDLLFLNELSQSITEIMCENGMRQGIEYELEQFTTSTQLIQKLQNDKNFYQLLLLDIELEKENGIEIAKLLREQEITSSIIFITSHHDYIYDCFGVNPLWYLLKPLNLEKFKEILLSDYRKSYNDRRLVVKIEGRQMAIFFHDIYALESTQHRTRIWLKERFYDWNGALSTLKQQLPMLSFAQSHNSYMINLSHVKEILRTDVFMDNDTTFPISRRYHDLLLEKYFTYLK